MALTEEVKQARALLKEQGINSRQVGVRLEYAGYERVLRANIKDTKIDKKLVESILIPLEDIDYDDYRGEILRGGNTYIRVAYDT